MFKVLSPVVLKALKWTAAEVQQPETDPSLANADSTIMRHLGTSVITVATSATHDVLGHECFKQDPLVVATVLESGLRGWIVHADQPVTPLVLQVSARRVATAYSYAAYDDTRVQAAVAALASDSKKRRRLGEQLCSLLLSLNKIANMSLSCRGICDKWLAAEVACITMQVGNKFAKLFAPAASSSSARSSSSSGQGEDPPHAVSVEWLVLLARSFRLLGRALCHESQAEDNDDDPWVLDEMGTNLAGVAMWLQFLQDQLLLLEQPKAAAAAGLMAEKLPGDVQRLFEECMSATTRYLQRLAQFEAVNGGASPCGADSAII